MLLIFLIYIYLSGGLKKPLIFLVGFLVESVFHRMWLLPFSKVEFASVMRFLAYLEALNKKYLGIPHCASVTFSTVKEFQLFQKINYLIGLKSNRIVFLFYS